MIRSHLGVTIDIHGGGGDLRFPHHDCEHSQSAAANGAPLARYWVHNGMLLVNGRKMSKSDGNFVTVRELLDAGGTGAGIRLALLRSHYRGPLDWQDSHVEASRTVDRWRKAMSRRAAPAPEPNAHGLTVLAPLLDDLNTHGAIMAMHALARDLADARGTDADAIAAGMAFGAGLLGIDLSPAEVAIPGAVAALADERAAARAAKDFARSDVLRREIDALGFSVRDTKEGQVVEPKSAG
jgi:cysteinyl-tRNA synthetase